MTHNILVTGVGGRSVGAGILHSLHRSSSVKERCWNVVAADADPFSWGLYVVPRRTLLPPAVAPNYIEEVRKAVRRFDIHAIIPGTEIETQVLAGQSAALGVPVITNSPGLIPLMMDKRLAEVRLRDLGVPSVPSYAPHQAAEAVREHGFPLVAKPAVGSGGSRGLALIMDQVELDAHLERSAGAESMIIQPYLGTPEEEYTVGVLHLADGTRVDSIVMRRKLVGLSLLQQRRLGEASAAISTGYSQGFFVEDPQIRAFCEDLADRLGSRGPLNLQLRRHAGRLYVFEIHPRFSGTTPMRADVGFNEPDILLRHALFGESFGPLGYRTGVAVIRAFEHTVVDLSELSQPG
ncbi:MAG: ATP-grasp domain-containing protein [Verrucomicrobia bacterium]|nr:ATP-grasp domain-containing protein [Verrucomicrobiota bacterium]